MWFCESSFKYPKLCSRTIQELFIDFVNNLIASLDLQLGIIGIHLVCLILFEFLLDVQVKQLRSCWDSQLSKPDAFPRYAYYLSC